jgi:hypothetical protein
MAIVERLNRFLALRPVVRVIDTGVVYDLEKVRNIVIKGPNSGEINNRSMEI